jgi:hypothetical protein
MASKRRPRRPISRTRRKNGAGRTGNAGARPAGRDLLEKYQALVDKYELLVRRYNTILRRRMLPTTLALVAMRASSAAYGLFATGRVRDPKPALAGRCSRTSGCAS